MFFLKKMRGDFCQTLENHKIFLFKSITTYWVSDALLKGLLLVCASFYFLFLFLFLQMLNVFDV